MAVSVQWTGLEEFRQALHELPEHLTQEAAAIVLQAASDLERDMQTAYPIGPQGSPKSNSGRPPGGLRRGVSSRVESSSGLRAKASVRSAAPHVYIFERGTVQRTNKRGQNRGTMPEAKESERLVPHAIRARRRMVQQLIEIVQRSGLVVTQS